MTHYLGLGLRIVFPDQLPFFATFRKCLLAFFFVSDLTSQSNSVTVYIDGELAAAVVAHATNTPLCS